MPTTVTLSTQGAVAIEREERRRCIPRGEGLSSDRPTFLRSPVKTFGRFSVRGPAAWRRMAVREKTVTRCEVRVKPYPTICGWFGTATSARRISRCVVLCLLASRHSFLYVFVVPGEDTVQEVQKGLIFVEAMRLARVLLEFGLDAVT